MVVGLEAETLLGLQGEAISDTLPVVSQRIEAVMISVEGLEEAEVEMEMQREMNLTFVEGDPFVSYEGTRAELEPGMEYQMQEGQADVFCVEQKPQEAVSLAPGGC